MATTSALKSALPHALTVAVCLTVTLRGVTVVPMSTPEFAQHRTETEGRNYLSNDLGTAFGYHVRGSRQSGSDQSIEFDTFVHSGASSPYVMATILNFLSEGGSRVTVASEGGAGADIRGSVGRFQGSPCHVEVHDSGRVDTVRCFEASYREDGPNSIGERQSFIDHDHRSTHPLAGSITEVDAVRFSNNWSLRVNGDSLELWDSRGVVHIFR